MTDTLVNDETHTAPNYRLAILCVLFGIGTWMPVNAIYTQMPIFIQSAPEGWSLPSHFSLLTQMTNIATLLCYLFEKQLASCQPILISFFLILGTVSIFALAFTYDITTFFFGQFHSICFYIFSFGSALVGCVSSVLFLPFMNKLPEVYLVPFFIGEGLSGLIPSSISAVQSVGSEICKEGILTYEKPVFTSGLFLIIISSIMLMSTVAFAYLHYFFPFASVNVSPTKYEDQDEGQSNQLSISKGLFAILLAMQTVINCFANGILPSIQSYSCLPYGSLAYHWSVVLNQIASPLVMYIAFFLPLMSLRVLTICMMIQISCWVYELLTAFMSPSPPLSATVEGAVVVVSFVSLFMIMGKEYFFM